MADTPLRIALLIDADNAPAEMIDEILNELSTLGVINIRRAYGRVEHLQTQGTVWRRLGVELAPSLPLEKCTTDAGLIADAVELCWREGVRSFAIVSGDADFAPLAVRLRRWGCQVWCFAASSTLFQGAELYYDKVVRCQNLDKPQAMTPVAQHMLRQKAFSVESAPSARAFGSELSSPPTPAQKAPSRSVQKKEQKTSTNVQPALVQAVLKACPELRNGQPYALAQAIPLLRQHRIIKKNEKLRTWAPRLQHVFHLQPSGQPCTIQYLPSKASANASGGRTLQTALETTVQPVDGPCVPRQKWQQPLPQHLVALRRVLQQYMYQKVSVADVLRCMPELRDGRQRFMLSGVEGRLRAGGLLALSHSALRILQRYPESFELNGAQAPPWVRYRGDDRHRGL